MFSLPVCLCVSLTGSKYIASIGAHSNICAIVQLPGKCRWNVLKAALCFSGAVAQDGRIEPGDMILEVNGISFENMSNDDAVRTLREAVQKPG